MRFQLYEYLDSLENTDDSVLVAPTPIESTVEPWIQNLDIDSKLSFGTDTLTFHSLNHTKPPRKQQDKINALSLTQDVSKFSDSQSVDNLINLMQNCFKTEINKLQQRNNLQIAKIKQHKREIEEAERQRKLAEAKEKERLRIEEEKKLQRQKQEALKKQKEIELKEKQELEIKKQNDAEALKKKEQEEQVEQERKAAQERYMTNFNKIEQDFQKYKTKIKWIKEKIVIPVKDGDKIIKNNLGKNKRKINPKFGQLTHSIEQLNNIQTELYQLVKQTQAATLSYQWTLNFIAKAMVHQAETEIGVKPENSVPLAKLAIFLLEQFPELSDLLMARFVKKCPYVIGYNCPIDTEEGRLKMGWKRKLDDKWEDDITYDERMSGIMTFYAVITRSPSQLDENWNIIALWRVMARICNLPTETLTNTHFVILGALWDASAYQFIKTFGNQSDKLLQLVGNTLTSSVANKKFVGAARLRILWEDWATNHVIKQFPEMESK